MKTIPFAGAHTPEPWTQSGAGIIRGANGVVVADARTEPGVRSDHEMAANVTLIVRAPEIPKLEAQRDALADALEAIRRHELLSAAELEKITGEPVARLPWMDQLESALRVAGRLPDLFSTQGRHDSYQLNAESDIQHALRQEVEVFKAQRDELADALETIVVGLGNYIGSLPGRGVKTALEKGRAALEKLCISRLRPHQRAIWYGNGQFPRNGVTGTAWPAFGFDDPDSPEQGAYCFLPDDFTGSGAEEGTTYYCDPDKDLEFVTRRPLRAAGRLKGENDA